jgi:hypothetical protein
MKYKHFLGLMLPPFRDGYLVGKSFDLLTTAGRQENFYPLYFILQPLRVIKRLLGVYSVSNLFNIEFGKFPLLMISGKVL